jgi:hypothetical protein
MKITFFCIFPAAVPVHGVIFEVAIVDELVPSSYETTVSALDIMFPFAQVF